MILKKPKEKISFNALYVMIGSISNTTYSLSGSFLLVMMSLSVHCFIVLAAMAKYIFVKFFGDDCICNLALCCLQTVPVGWWVILCFYSWAWISITLFYRWHSGYRFSSVHFTIQTAQWMKMILIQNIYFTDPCICGCLWCKMCHYAEKVNRTSHLR